MVPDEVDGPEDVADGSAMGAKRAAVRKLDHELGIKAGTLPVSSLRRLTDCGHGGGWMTAVVLATRGVGSRDSWGRRLECGFH